MFKRVITLWLFTQAIVFIKAQESVTDNWDNELWTGTRVVWGQGKWKFSGEFQTRFNQNFKYLERWFIEGSARYMVSPHFEIIPDLRYSIRSIDNEFRSGLGIIYKASTGKVQFVNQFKGQMDKASGKRESWGLRDIIYLNYAINEKWTPFVGGGVFFRERENFSGIEIIRGGIGTYFSIDPKHVLSINYFVGTRNTGTRYVYSGIAFFQLTFKFDKEYKYVPANFLNF